MDNPNKNWWMPTAVTVIAAVGSFLLSRVLWPDVAGMPMPDGAQLPLLIGVGAIESIAFGIGVSFLIFGWKFMIGRSASDWLVFFSAAWGLVSWWPHDNMHRVMMMGDYWGLIRLEYGFHLTLIIAGVLIASYLWKQWIPRT